MERMIGKAALLLALVCFALPVYGFDNPVVPGGAYGPLHFGTTTVINGQLKTHAAVDILAACGMDVLALTDGTVVDVISSEYDRDFTKRSPDIPSGTPLANTRLGYMVMIEHNTPLIAKNFYTFYIHLKSPPLVSVGQKVRRRDVIGRVGKTGAANNTCHTHFEVRYFRATGEGNRYLPAWGNIYGPGDLSQSPQLTDNFADPEVFFLIFGGTPKAPNIYGPRGLVIQPVNFRWKPVSGATWYRILLYHLNGNTWQVSSDQWYQSSVCTATECSLQFPASFIPDHYDWWLQPWSPPNTYGVWVNEGGFQIDSNLVHAQQAVLDMAKRAHKDGRFDPLIPERIGEGSGDQYWEYRWFDLNFTNGRTATIWHITDKQDATRRYTIYFDPDTNQWNGWTLVP